MSSEDLLYISFMYKDKCEQHTDFKLANAIIYLP